MPTYRVVVTRTKTVVESCVVLVKSSSELYAPKDAADEAEDRGTWIQETSDRAYKTMIVDHDKPPVATRTELGDLDDDPEETGY